MPYEFLHDLFKQFQKGAPRELTENDILELGLSNHLDSRRFFASHWEIPLRDSRTFSHLFTRYTDAGPEMEQAGIKSELSRHPEKDNVAILTLATDSQRTQRIRRITDATEKWLKLKPTA